MPPIIFSHEKIDKDLSIDIGVDECSWGYSLNTRTYPTYGGEVVQILSVFVDDLQLSGTIPTYEKMENIYAWFLEYMSLATQGQNGDGSYNTKPVFVNYPFRNWTWWVYPESLPGFRYGREVIAPTWQLSCKVWEADGEITELALEAAVAGLERVPLGIGFNPDNPFSDPMASTIDKDGKKKETTKKDLEKFYEDSVDKFVKLIPAYMEGDFESLLGPVGSKPSFLNPKTGDGRPGDQNRDTPKKR